MTLAEVNAYRDERGVAAHTPPDMLVATSSLPTSPIDKIDKKAIAQQIGKARTTVAHRSNTKASLT